MKTAMIRSRSARPGSRYGSVKTGSPYGNLPPQGAHGRAEIVHGLVADPFPVLSARQPAAINVRTDALETEYAYGRVSEASYRALRVYGAILERAASSPSAGGQWSDGDRVDAASSHELAIWRQLSSAKKALELVMQTRALLGELSERILVLVLVERLTFAQVSQTLFGKSDRYSVGHCAWALRVSGDALADFWSSSRAAMPAIWD